jgi:hypothetical protein
MITTLYHGSEDNFDQFKLLDTGHDQFGTGIYFTPDFKVAKSYGNVIYTLPHNTLKINDEKDRMKASLTNHIIAKTPNKEWWTDWAEHKPKAITTFKRSLTGVLGEDLQTLWYNLYRYAPTEFCQVVSPYIQACKFDGNGLIEVCVYDLDTLNSNVVSKQVISDDE